MAQQPSQQQQQQQQQAVARAHFVGLPTLPPGLPAAPPPFLSALPQAISLPTNAAVSANGQLVYCNPQHLVRNPALPSVNAMAFTASNIQSLVRKQPPPLPQNLFSIPPPPHLPTPAPRLSTEQQPVNTPGPLDKQQSSSSDGALITTLEMNALSTTVAKETKGPEDLPVSSTSALSQPNSVSTSSSSTTPAVTAPFQFTSNPPPYLLSSQFPHFAVGALPVVVQPSTLGAIPTNRPPPPLPTHLSSAQRLATPGIAPSSLARPANRAVKGNHESSKTGSFSTTTTVNADANIPQATSRRREEFLQNLIFKVDESKFLAENRNRAKFSGNWSRSVPSEPYFYWNKDGNYGNSPLYDKLVGDFELCVTSAPARVNSSRMLEPPPRPTELDTLYLGQGHHHHHHHHHHKKKEKGTTTCSHDDSDSDHSNDDSDSSDYCDDDDGSSNDGSISSGSSNSSNEMESGEISDSDDCDTNNAKCSSRKKDTAKNGRKVDESIEKSGHRHSSAADNKRADMNAKLISAEMDWRSRHPAALHSDIWFNIENLGNFGPTCRCSHRARRSGFRHNIFPHEMPPPKCIPNEDNRAVLRHFRLDIKPSTNLVCQEPTQIGWDDHIYLFEGFSLLVHGEPATVIPPCTVNRYGIMYTVELVEEPVPTAFSVGALDLITDYLLKNLLNLFELQWLKSFDDACRLFHVFPRFARNGPDGSKELLSIPVILMHLNSNFRPVVPFDRASADKLASLPDGEWNDWRLIKLGQLVTKPGYLPGAIRLDQVDRVIVDKEAQKYEIRLCHWTTQPQQMNYLRNAAYVRAWRKLMKYRYLLSNKSEITASDRQRLRELSDEVSRIQSKRANENSDDRNSAASISGCSSKNRLLIELNPTGFYFTGLRTDIAEHALFLPAVVFHMRIHGSLRGLEAKLGYHFKDRSLYQLALTHSSYTGHIGTNADHVHNAQSNCGVRHPVYGDSIGKNVNPFKTRRKGVVQLTQLMASIDRDSTTSLVNTGADMHNERLEFLGDAVLSFVVNRHIFFMFPNASEGTLSIYHSALVSNENFFRIAKNLELESYLLYSHGPDLCVRSALDHAMANTIEALHGAIYLEAGLDAVDEVFAGLLFGNDPTDEDLYKVWQRVPLHPIQAEEPNGDRHWIEKSPVLQRLTKLEESIGVEFTHIRLLAQSMANIDTAHVLTRGNNERLEFFGDYILQLVVTDYLFHRFPRHHEGGLSLLRATLLQATTQALMAKDLQLADYLLRPRPISKKKTLADILEAFVGALYVDKGLDHVRVLCEVSLYPRLHQIVLDQSWNDPKSRLQMLCITQRDLDKEPDMPRYRVLAQMPVGPNGPRFEVAVYFRRQRLSVGVGRSKQEAEVAAAQNAIATHGHQWAEMRRQERLLSRMRNGESADSTAEDFAASVDTYIQDAERKVNNSANKVSHDDIPRKRRRKSSRSDDSDVEDEPFRFPGPCNDAVETANNSGRSNKNKAKNRRSRKRRSKNQQQQNVHEHGRSDNKLK